MTIQPIFVIGRNRSGTKWLSNLISQHPEIACVKDKRFGGILETNVFNNMPRCFGDLKLAENLAAFYIIFSKTSFFKKTGLKEEELFSIRPENYADFFNKLMCLYAQSLNKNYWLQKSHPDSLDYLIDNYPNAQYIFIKRNIVDNIRSSITNLARNNKKIKKRLLLNVAWYVHDIKIMQNAIEKNKIEHEVVSYSNLNKDRIKNLKQISRLLKIKYSKEMEESPYTPNTSFTEHKKNEILSKYDEMLIEKLYFFCKLFPLRFYIIIKTPAKIIKNLFSKDESTNLSFIKATFHLFLEDIKWVPEGVNNTKTPIMKSDEILNNLPTENL
ncbi:hypothetical protein KKHLCK_12050 [Candidatus Electrothrix laxa]